MRPLPTAGSTVTAANPLDVLEEIVHAHEWQFNRQSESELTAEFAGRWCGYQLCFIWQPDLGAVFVTCYIDLRVPEPRRGAVYELLVRANENLWLGHFDVIGEDEGLMFRHTVPLRGAPGVSAEQFEDLVDAAITECERFYPALQSVIWGGQPVREALAAARMETLGEA
jgi:hypothetical protein